MATITMQSTPHRFTIHDVSFVAATVKAALRPSRCPRCEGVLVRDLAVSKLTYVCQGCATRWVSACSAS